MNQKYRVHEVAKDLNVPSTEIINLLAKHFDSTKKHMTALTKEELDIVFEHFTQENQVKSFKEYFDVVEEKTKIKEDEQRQAQEELKKAEEKARIKAEQEKKKAEEQARKKAEEERKKIEEEARLKAEEERKKLEEQAHIEAAQKLKKAEEERIKAEEETHIKAEENRKKAEKEAQDKKEILEQEKNNSNININTVQQTQTKAVQHKPSEDSEKKEHEDKNIQKTSEERKPFERQQDQKPYQNNQNNQNKPIRRQDSQGQQGYVNRPNQTNTQNRPYQQRQDSQEQNRPYQQNNQGQQNNQNRPYQQNNQGQQNNQNRPYQQNNQGQQNTQNRPYQQRQDSQNQNRPYQQNNQGQQNRPYQQNNQGQRFGQQKPAFQKPMQDNKTTDIAKPAVIKTNDPASIQRQKGETVQRGEQIVRTVDTRGSYVNLDKYNERYEQIAPGLNKTAKDTFTHKQKINQKSQKSKSMHSTKRETESEKLKRLELERARKQQLKVLIPDEIVVSELASRLKIVVSQVIKKLMSLGIMAGINEVIDFDTASLVAMELGAKVEKEVIVTIEDRLFNESEDTDENSETRSPIVVVMGHVDHGKTSLLDKIRNANVTDSEAGGITQHIGAYRVMSGGKEITFLDTPGHEAFTSMRARGAQVTDIAILVVAADDGIMPQTIEAINHAKAADVSIIVAINKIDKETANPSRIKQELTEHGLVIEEWGGDIICVEVSAKTGQGINELLEMVNLISEVKELKANPNRLARGTVIEARLDKGRGPIATLLVQTGTLHSGDIIIAGTSVGRVRVMYDDKGNIVKSAGPSVPVEIMGLDEAPSAGELFNSVENEKLARELVEQRKHEAKEEQFKSYQKVTLDNLFSQIEQGEVKELPIIVKADVQGSVEAVRQSLEKISNAEVRVRVIHGGVGAISESDVMLANASNAIIVGFNVRPHPQAAINAERDGIDIRLYRIIYDAIEEISTAMKGLLAPKHREVSMARIEVRQVFKVSNVGTIAGCYVLDGKVNRNCKIRLVRDGIVITEDELDSLRRFKDDVKEVAQGYECGIGLSKYNDIKEHDIFEAYIIEEYREN